MKKARYTAPLVVWWCYALGILLLFTGCTSATAVSARRVFRSPFDDENAAATISLAPSWRQRRSKGDTLPHPWRIHNSHGQQLRPSEQLVFLLSGLALSPPSKRIVITGCLALFALHRIRRLSRSEPVRRAVYFWVHAGPIIAHYKFTNRVLNLKRADKATRERVWNTLHDRYAQPSLDLIFALRGLFVKLGQIMSSRPDFLPLQYQHVFTELQDNVPPWDVDVVHEVALTALREECPSFKDEYDDLVLDPVALGSASIGQVHRAVLHRKDNTTKEVAVKVMHRGARERFVHDFQVFRWLCKVALPTWRDFLDALEGQVMTEFDYRNEADSLREVRRNMQQSPYRRRVCVPEPMEELCCEHVLVMEMLHGKKLIDSIQDRFAAAIGGNRQVASKFLNARRHEVMTGEDAGSKEMLREVLSPLGRIRLFILFIKLSRVINLLVDTHGYQIFRTGTKVTGHMLAIIQRILGICGPQSSHLLLIYFSSRAGTWNGDPHFGKNSMMV